MQEVPSTENIIAEQIDHFGNSASRRASDPDLFSGMLNSHFDTVRAARPTGPAEETPENRPAPPEAENSVHGETDTPVRHAVSDNHAREQRPDTADYRQAEPAKRPGVEEGVRLAKGKSTLEEDEPELKDARDIRMTKEDLSELLQGLREFGFSNKELKALENRIESSEGLSWGQFVQWVNSRMNGMDKSFNLDASETQQLESFFGEIGFNSKEIGALMDKLRSGQRMEVFQAVSDRLGTLDQNQLLEVSEKQSRALAKALGLTGQDAKNLQESLTGARLPQELQNALQAMKQDIPELKEFKLASRVSEVMQAAMVRAEESGDDIQRLRQAHDQRGITDKAVDSQSEAVKHIRKAEAQQPQPEQQGRDMAEDGSQKESDSAEDKAWQQFFSRLRADNNTMQQLRTDLQHSAAAENATEAAKSAKSATPRWANTSTSRLMEQVEQGVYRSMGQGNGKLTIKLTPEHLGALSIALTSRGGEVGAMIRAENPETARMLSEHIESLRSHLENQGIKVDKIDVQSGLNSFGSSSGWLGEEQHNQAMQRETLAKIRERWNKMRGEGGEGAELARDLQNDVGQAILAGERIHIIA